MTVVVIGALRVKMMSLFGHPTSLPYFSFIPNNSLLLSTGVSKILLAV